MHDCEKSLLKTSWIYKQMKSKNCNKKHALKWKFEVVWDLELYQLAHLHFAKNKIFFDRLTKSKVHVIENKVLKMQSTHEETI